jgi:beta-lactamase superfamily II metal-dependent hydrolase
MFTLHVIQAEFGDSLLIEYGSNGSSKFILIDGGPTNVYNNFLRENLEQKVGAGGELEALIVTHVDIDHIKGILDLLAELQSNADNDETPFLNVKDLWLNTFSKTIDTDNNLSNRINSIFSTAASNGVQMASTAIALNGIKEGNKVTTFCNILNIPMNAPTSKGIFRVGSPNAPIQFDNLEFTIVGPTQENLDELQKEWDEWLAAREEEMGAGNFSILSMSDKSVPNLSSIMFLVKGDGKTILFTGDGRGDHLLQGLKKKGLLKNGRIHVDILKVAHHGSDRNTDRGFFENVTADTYVISANGKYSNPDYATLTWIVEAANAAGRQIELVVTNETPSTKKLIATYPPADWGYSIKYIPQNKSSIAV